MSREFVLGLDIGTTSVKACIFHLNGKLIAESEKMITSYYPKQGWVEQDPDEIVEYAVKAIREAMEKANTEKGELISLGISAAMHSLICVNENGEPLSPAIIWADGRSFDQAEHVLETMGNQVYSLTGTPIHPMTPLTKLLWMKETGYEPYIKAAYFMSIKEFVLFRWFNKRVIDFSMASATGMFNPNIRDWVEELLDLTGVNREQLSEIVPPTKVIIGMNSKIADDMGIHPDLPIVVGAADGQLANLGNGAILPGEVAVTVGTSGAIRQIAKGVRVSESRETFCYSFTEESSIIGGPTNNGGIALQWLKDLLNDQGSFEDFLQEAERVSPGSDGILFLPYINGERAPIWNQRAKGNFYGVTITHKREHFIRAVLEGITFNIYQIGQVLEKLTGAPKVIYVNGGLARSPLWLQMIADIFNTEIHVSENHHSAAWGAAWTSLVAINKVRSFEEIKENIPKGKITFPNEENSKLYKSIYEKYCWLAEDMRKFY